MARGATMPDMEPNTRIQEKGGATGKKAVQWFWILIVLLVVGGIVFMFAKKVGQEKPVPTAEQEHLQEKGAASSRGPSLSWEFAPAGGDPATGAPLTTVMLVVDGEVRELGTATGACSIVDGSSSTWALAEGEITGVVCYFAGAGEEYGVFYDAGAYVVKKGVVEEGSAETPGFRGNYEALFTI